MYSTRPAPAARTGRPLGRGPGLHSYDSVSRLDRLHRHVLHRPEQQLFQLRPHVVHGAELSMPAPSGRSIFGRCHPPSNDAQPSLCVRDHKKWTRAETHSQSHGVYCGVVVSLMVSSQVTSGRCALAPASASSTVDGSGSVHARDARTVRRHGRDPLGPGAAISPTRQEAAAFTACSPRTASSIETRLRGNQSLISDGALVAPITEYSTSARPDRVGHCLHAAPICRSSHCSSAPCWVRTCCSRQPWLRARSMPRARG